ncbi:tRNA epoxyqueuosine(34) reductase QueG [Thiohalobacter sp. IOR34]|uniref:tRNA epoxyqueuosine(34) reductase QueG n=1 Tax=Thiohalobacter sp. IOR34 TaxID=3057176 RepID=UPI0025B1F3F4|nr:tRNA epoxyqueuosine(34) reductase QueG [Thiohalobacter sp. IOR34]WJW74827.1 tRNA epoxyqueuosine(34) reductase QueG [Thiohalobacter sp. IOR34]
MSQPAPDAIDYADLARRIKAWGRELGFQQIGITDVDLADAERRLLDWLAAGYHGEMDYMARHGSRRSRPAELEPGTLRVISVRLDYWPEPAADSRAVLEDPIRAFISRYALGRDYHKLLRKRLQKLAARIEQAIGPFGYRAFTDSAPVLEKPLAQRAGLGWIGKHTNLINARAGSWFFLGELYTDLPLPVDNPADNHCGDCRACIDVCPTGAIIAPYTLDARRCISYLTIELHGPIPEALRPLLGNHIYGCDDCQLVCPWNRFSQPTPETDFLPRHGLDAAALIELFGWDEATFLRRTEGSPIRRIGHQRWLRNLAVALGNAPPEAAITEALAARLEHPSPLVREHVEWALENLGVSPEAARMTGVQAGKWARNS